MRLRRHGRRDLWTYLAADHQGVRARHSDYHFDGSLGDVFDLQDQIATSVSGVIEPTLRRAEEQRASRQPTASLDAYDLYLRALAEVLKDTAEGAPEAIALAKRAIEIDTSYAPPAAMVGFCRHQQRLRGWGPISEADVAEAVSLARQAIDIAGAERKVRIHSPPGESPQTICTRQWTSALLPKSARSLLAHRYPPYRKG